MSSQLPLSILYGVKDLSYNISMIPNGTENRVWNYFLTMIKPELEKNGIKVEIIPLSLSQKGYYMIDYVWDVVCAKYKNWNSDNIPILMVVLKLDENLKVYTIECQHTGIKRKYKKALQSVLNHHDWFQWSGKEKDVMNIDLHSNM